MPMIDVSTSNFHLSFSKDESELERKCKTIIYRSCKKNNLIHRKKQFPKNKHPYYNINATLQNALIIKKAFKDYNMVYTTDFKKFVNNLFIQEKKFKQIQKITLDTKIAGGKSIGAFNKNNKYEILGYEFKNEPWDHQKLGFYLMATIGSFILTWDMRTGKTFAVACAMEHRVNENPQDRTVILAPGNIILTTWISDVYKHTNLEGYAAYESSSKKRIESLRRQNINVPMSDGTFKTFTGEPSYIVLNHDAIRNKGVLDYIIKEYKPKNLIVDEFHCFKTPNSQRTKALLRISSYVHSKQGSVVLMSGTPVPKDIRDVFSPYSACDPNVFPYSLKEWKKRFCIMSGGYESGEEDGFEQFHGAKNQKKMKLRTNARSHRVLIQDVHDMPLKQRTIKYVEMTAEQRKHHESLKKEMIMDLPEDEGVLSVNSLTKLIKMVQITGGYVYNQSGKALLLKKNSKLLELENMLNQILANDKNNVVILSNYKPSIKILSDFLTKQEWEFSELTTSAKQARHLAVHDFQNNKDKRVMLAQPALCPGNDFSKANYAIFFDNSYKFVDRDQAETRIYTHTSIEHGKIVIIDLMCRNSVDEYIYNILERKRQGNADFTKENLMEFLKCKTN